MWKQVCSEQEVEFGNYAKLNWDWGQEVPSKSKLEITTLTLNYFPSGGGSIGRADIAGRVAGNVVWRLQVIYIEPKKTLHLQFPSALELGEGGHVEIGFIEDGPGTIFISANGKLDR